MGHGGPDEGSAPGGLRTGAGPLRTVAVPGSPGDKGGAMSPPITPGSSPSPASPAVGFAGALAGGALVGAAEATRALIGAGLHFSGAEAGTLLASGVLGGAAFGALGAAPLLVLPGRPAGRTRWSGFLVGVATPLLARVGVWWFSDPPPFTDPLPGQGNPVAFAGVVVAALVLLVGLYQGLRGPRAVAGGALAVAVGLAAWVGSGKAGPGAPTQKPPAGAPNVLLVTLDTTRADHMGAYGAEVDTRHFDDIAKQGALFENASAVAAVTGPSHTTMLTGTGPWDHGVLLNGIPIPEDKTTLAEILHDHGWNTGAFVSAYVLDGEKGFRRGFEVYDDDFGAVKGGDQLTSFQVVAMIQRHFNPDAELERRGDDTVDEALAWFGEQQGATFLWVHLFDAHGPYEPPPPFDTRYYAGDPRDPSNHSMDQVQNVAAYLKKSIEGITDLNYVLAQYSGEVSYADTQLGRLLEKVDPKNTLVVVIADHGESLGEHGVWFNHGDDVYETSLHVPFAMRWPGRITEGVKVEAPFEGTDLTPTILEVVGLKPLDSMTGVSAAGLVGAGEGQGRQLARAMCFDREANVTARAQGLIDKPKYRMASVRGQTSRYVLRETGATLEEYYDLATDPKGVSESSGTFLQTPNGYATLELFKEKANAVLSSTATERSAGDVGEEERKRLEALGYLDGTAPEGAAAPAAAAPAPDPAAVGQ